MRILLISLAALFGAIPAIPAGEACRPPACCTEVCGAADCCGRCGCHGCCRKYCRVVCEMKEVKKHVWVVECEDFCAPLPGCGAGCRGCSDPQGGACGSTCGVDCEGCCGKKSNPCEAERYKCFIPPHCGRVRTKKTLKKKEIVCKVPTYKCIVVYCCANCDPGKTPCEPEPAPSATPPAIAPSPAPDAPPPVATQSPSLLPALKAALISKISGGSEGS